MYIILISKVLYDFICITALARSKNGQFGLSGFHDTHPSQDFFLIIPEKRELSKEKCHYHQDDLVAKNKHKNAEKKFPEPESSFIKSNPTWNVTRNNCSSSTRNGKRA
jgi:hypothetical protein